MLQERRLDRMNSKYWLVAQRHVVWGITIVLPTPHGLARQVAHVALRVCAHCPVDVLQLSPAARDPDMPKLPWLAAWMALHHRRLLPNMRGLRADMGDWGDVGWITTPSCVKQCKSI